MVHSGRRYLLPLVLVAIGVSLVYSFVISPRYSKNVKIPVNDAPSTTTQQNMFLLDLFTKGEPSGVEIIDGIQTKDLNLITQIIAKGKEVVNAKDKLGNNAMHVIAKQGHYKFPPSNIPKLLINGGIDINAKNNEGKSALEISLLSGWQKIAYLLLDSGADRSVVTAQTISKITCPDCKRVVQEYSLGK